MWCGVSGTGGQRSRRSCRRPPGLPPLPAALLTRGCPRCSRPARQPPCAAPAPSPWCVWSLRRARAEGGERGRARADSWEGGRRRARGGGSATRAARAGIAGGCCSARRHWLGGWAGRCLPARTWRSQTWWGWLRSRWAGQERLQAGVQRALGSLQMAWAEPGARQMRGPPRRTQQPLLVSCPSADPACSAQIRRPRSSGQAARAAAAAEQTSRAAMLRASAALLRRQVRANCGVQGSDGALLGAGGRTRGFAPPPRRRRRRPFLAGRSRRPAGGPGAHVCDAAGAGAGGWRQSGAACSGAGGSVQAAQGARPCGRVPLRRLGLWRCSRSPPAARRALQMTVRDALNSGALLW